MDKGAAQPRASRLAATTTETIAVQQLENIARSDRNPHRPLRIIQIVEASIKGIAQHVIGLARCLAKSGHEVHILFSAMRIDPIFSTGLTSLGTLGVRSEQIDMHRSPHPSDVGVIWRIKDYIKRLGKIDVLHCHSTKAGFVGRLAGIGVQCKCVYTPNAFFSMSPNMNPIYSWAARSTERFLSQIGHAVICVSREEREHARAIGLSNAKTFVIANGIDLTDAQNALSRRTEFRSAFGMGDHEICVGFVGRLVPQKAPQVLLHAFAQAIRQSPSQARLVIVGEGPLSNPLRDLASRLGIDRAIIFAGEMPGISAMAAFDIIALSSKYEGCPYVLIEALAMGLPAVSTAVGGVRDLISDGVNGLVVPVDSVDELAGSLRSLIGNERVRRRMAAAALSMAPKFTVERMALETEHVYHHILTATE